MAKRFETEGSAGAVAEWILIWGLQFPSGQRPAWLNERGAFLPEKLPLDSTLARALSGDKRECREAVRLLGVMRQSGRVEAGIYLMVCWRALRMIGNGALRS